MTRTNHPAKLLRLFACLILLLCAQAFPESVKAATYYLSPQGTDSSTGTYSQPFKTLTKAMAVGSGSDTYIYKDGTYNYSGSEIASGIKNGTSVAYTVIKAEHDGAAVITINGGLNLPHSAQYLQIEGFKFNWGNEKFVLGNHIKFFRCAFQGGGSSGNVANTTIGSDAYPNTDDTSYILFEECWWFGLGGRYNVQVFNVDHLIMRRCVIRHDGGWTDSKGDPEAGINFYNSSNCIAQNVIIIDSNLSYHSWMGSFVSGYNSSSGPHRADNNSWIGCIALVGQNVGWSFGDGSNYLIQDSVAWDTVNGGITWGPSGSNSGTINRVTLGRSKLAASGDWRGGIGAWNSGTKTIRNAVITNWTSGTDLDGVTGTYFDSYNNGTISSGLGSVSYIPFANGLLYLLRIENATFLKTIGLGGGGRSGRRSRPASGLAALSGEKRVITRTPESRSGLGLTRLG